MTRKTKTTREECFRAGSGCAGGTRACDACGRPHCQAHSEATAAGRACRECVRAAADAALLDAGDPAAKAVAALTKAVRAVESAQLTAT